MSSSLISKTLYFERSLHHVRALRSTKTSHFGIFSSKRINFQRSKQILDMAVDSITTESNSLPFPRAAVSTTVRFPSKPSPHYILVQRGKQPNKGMWSLPGGKIETGESTLGAGQRELSEECIMNCDALKKKNCKVSLNWYRKPFTCTDAIFKDENNDSFSFHYMIAQCFAAIEINPKIEWTEEKDPLLFLPQLEACDDAKDAKWFTLQEVEEGVNSGMITKGVYDVLTRAEELHSFGLLPVEKDGDVLVD